MDPYTRFATVMAEVMAALDEITEIFKNEGSKEPEQL